jgi:hypothetical protein
VQKDKAQCSDFGERLLLSSSATRSPPRGCDTGVMIGRLHILSYIGKRMLNEDGGMHDVFG